MNIADRRISRAAWPALVLALPAACTTDSNGIDFAEADIAPANDGDVTGIVRFTDEMGYVHVSGTLEGLEPGQHEVLLFEPGLCDELAGQRNRDSGPAERQVAEIASITTDQRGETSIDTLRTNLPESDGSADLLGHSVIVTAANGELDEASGCGVVRAIPQIDYTL